MYNENLVPCKACGKDVAKGIKFCPNCGKDQRNFFMRHKILTGFIVIIMLGAILGVDSDDDLDSGENTKEVYSQEQEETDKQINETEKPIKEMEDSGEVGEPVKKDIKPAEDRREVQAKKDVPREYKSALNKAESYANRMHMSKAAVYNQLISEYGEQFPEDAAQYAMDNLEADWKNNALKKAETYANKMDMSKAAIYDQLISEYGEQFTEEQAQYAIDNLD